MTIVITYSGNNLSEQQIASVFHGAAASLGLQGQVRLDRTTADGDGTARAAAAPNEIVFTELPDTEIARIRIARAAGIKTILFVCTGNAIRSQMAEALVNHLFRGKWAAFSAGVMPMAVPPDVVGVMREAGIDMTAHRSKHVELFKDCVFDRVVILCSDAERFCPNLPDCSVKDHMIFDDPLSSSLMSEGIVFSLKSTLRSLRDEMKKTLAAYLNEQQ